MTPTKTINLYLTENDQIALRKVYDEMKSMGLPCEYGGKMNTSAVIRYALEQQSRRSKRT